MGLSEHVIEGLIESGKLHDIGKFKISLEIFSKSGKLSVAEFELEKEHSRSGYEALRDIKSPWLAAEVADACLELFRESEFEIPHWTERVAMKV